MEVRAGGGFLGWPLAWERGGAEDGGGGGSGSGRRDCERACGNGSRGWAVAATTATDGHPRPSVWQWPADRCVSAAGSSGFSSDAMDECPAQVRPSVVTQAALHGEGGCGGGGRRGGADVPALLPHLGGTGAVRRARLPPATARRGATRRRRQGAVPPRARRAAPARPSAPDPPAPGAPTPRDPRVGHSFVRALNPPPPRRPCANAPRERIGSAPGQWRRPRSIRWPLRAPARGGRAHPCIPHRVTAATAANDAGPGEERVEGAAPRGRCQRPPPTAVAGVLARGRGVRRSGCAAPVLKLQHGHNQRPAARDPTDRRRCMNTATTAWS